MSIDYEDMISIDDLTESSMVQNTCNRYKRDCISNCLLHMLNDLFDLLNIYTWIGEVLVAVNPWKEIKTPPYVCNIMQPSYCLIVIISKINTVVERAYKNVLRDKVPQAILVSGESGSGKTESCKFISTAIFH